MYIIGRILIGFVILALAGGLWFLLYSLVVGFLTSVTLAVGQCLRLGLRVRGYHKTIVSLGGTAKALAETTEVWCFSVALFWYAFMYPIAPRVGEVAAGLLVLLVVFVHLPGAFMLAIGGDLLGLEGRTWPIRIGDQPGLEKADWFNSDEENDDDARADRRGAVDVVVEAATPRPKRIVLADIADPRTMQQLYLPREIIERTTQYDPVAVMRCGHVSNYFDAETRAPVCLRCLITNAGARLIDPELSVRQAR
jgi:hypothetical protein